MIDGVLYAMPHAQCVSGRDIERAGTLDSRSDFAQRRLQPQIEPTREIWHLNLRHLVAVAKIVEHGTVKSAAIAVNLTQPAISQALGRLEARLGMPLFERCFDGMVPNRAALILAARIDEAMRFIANPHVTMPRLRALLALADGASYTRAGQIAGLSASAIYRNVADLEISMRCKLVQRQGMSLVLTECGLRTSHAFRLAKIELELGLSEIANNFR